MNRTHDPISGTTQADPARLRAHVEYLASRNPPRSYEHVAVLDEVAAYIGRHFREAGARVEDQPYLADGRTYRNVIGSFGPAEGPRVIVGAHYDVCGELPGADDNGSGVAALLELARRLGQEKTLPVRLDLVAFSLEEPPYFMTEQMGSFVHAQSLRRAGADVRGMVALEMLGYYDDREGAQEYPLPQMAKMYGTRGDFIAVVQKTDGGAWPQRFAARFAEVARLPVKQYRGPAEVPGMSFSDHASYWRHSFPALMLTNTAFYRNKNYHQPTDTPETLDYERIARIADAVAQTLLTM